MPMGCHVTTQGGVHDPDGPGTGQPPQQSQQPARPVVVAQLQQPAGQRPGQQPPPRPGGVQGGAGVQDAPIVQSLVSLQKSSDCTVESREDGCYLKFVFSALSLGEAVVYLSLGTEDEVDLGTLPQESRRTFEKGLKQECRLLVCKDLKSSLEGRPEDKWQIALELRATDSRDAPSAPAVTMQRSYLKLNAAHTSAQVAKQKVQCGSIVRNAEALYGTMPNPKGTAGQQGEDSGECVICLTQPKNVVILHCRHVCLCRSCAAITSSTWSFQCPVCRGRVAAMVAVTAPAGAAA